MQGTGTAPSTQGLGFEVPPLRVGSLDEVRSSGSRYSGYPHSPGDRFLAARFPLSVRKLSPKPGPTGQSGQLLSAPGPDPTGPQSGPTQPLAEESPGLACPLKAARLSPERTRVSSWCLRVCQSVRVPGKGRHPLSLRLRASPPLLAHWLVYQSFLGTPGTCGMALSRGLSGEGPAPSPVRTGLARRPLGALALGQIPAGLGNLVSEESQGSAPRRNLAEARQGPHPPTPNGSSGSVPNF